jgi:trehalose synthase
VGVLESVPIGRLPLDRFASVLPPDRYRLVLTAAERARRLLRGRVIWNVNSTARGGGVAEMLISLLAYAHGVGVDARWMVIGGNDRFFGLTKRIHNNLHSAPGDGGELGEAERQIYEQALGPNIAEFAKVVDPRDLVIVHDPQPAELIPRLKELGVPVIWRCHVGSDVPSELSRRAWKFLSPYVRRADAYVFSRQAFVWEGLAGDKIELIAPVIDAFSPQEPGARQRRRGRHPAGGRTQRRRHSGRAPVRA